MGVSFATTADTPPPRRVRITHRTLPMHHMRLASVHAFLAATVLVLGATAQEITESSTFTNPVASSPDRFGTAIAIDTNRAAVSRLQDFSTGNPSGFGFIDMYVRSGGAWTLETTLTVDEELAGDRFGAALALDGDTLAVGAPGRDDFGQSSGAVYIYTHTTPGWHLEGKIVAPDAQSWEQFGNTLDLDGQRLVVGTSYGLGGAYVFTRSGSSWSLEQQLEPALGPDFSANFGSDVAVDGNIIAVGADGYDGVSYDSGAVYVLERNAGVWSETTRLESADLTIVTSFGRSVDLANDKLLVGAITGRAYVFERHPDGTWSSEAYLEPCADAGDYGLGMTVAWSGERALVPSLDDSAVYVFEANAAVPSEWGVTARLTSSVGASGDEFGQSLAAGTDEIWVGSPGAANEVGVVTSFDPDDINPWIDLCGGLAGSQGKPQLETAGMLVAGAPATFEVSGAAPSTLAVLVIGLTQVDVPFKGGTLVPGTDILLGLGTDTFGSFKLTAPWPTGVPSDFSLWAQAWITDAAGPVGFSATNAVTATTN